METKRCKNCQKSINKDLRVCPECGSKQPEPVWAIALVVLFAIGALYGISTPVEDSQVPNNQNESSKAESSSIKEETKKTSPSEEKKPFKVGEQLETQGLKITFDSSNLNFTNYSRYASVKEGNKIVEFKFTAENIGERDRSFNYYDFNCYADDQKMQQFYSTEDSGLDSGGTISSGKRASLPVYCEVPSNASKITVEYSPLLSDNHYEFLAS